MHDVEIKEIFNYKNYDNKKCNYLNELYEELNDTSGIKKWIRKFTKTMNENYYSEENNIFDESN